MIKLEKVSLNFADQIVFDNISTTFQPDEKIALVGKNGSGKSTLLKAIAGTQLLDKGKITISSGCKVAYMPQEVVLNSQDSVFEETLKVFPEVFAAEKELIAAEAAFEINQTNELAEQIASHHYTLQEHNATATKVRVERMLAGLGFTQARQKIMVSTLSVGWKMRIVLAQLLLQDADFYLFDEPTNHLDLSTQTWFLNFLADSNFGYLLVCHDRYFLDKACTKTVEVWQGNAKEYAGNYSYFLTQREAQNVLLERAYREQQKDHAQRWQTIHRFKASASKAKMAQSMIKAIEREEKLSMPPTPPQINVKLRPPTPSGRQVLLVQNVSFGYKPNQPLFSHANLEIEKGEKVALVAPNGVGKSTFFNLIAERLKPTTGTIEFGHNVHYAIFDQDQNQVLVPTNSILEEIKSSTHCSDQEIRTMCGCFLFSGDEIMKPIKVLSGGERNRVAMVKILLSKANFLLLDEPTNHLDIESKEIVLKALQNYEGTVLFVAHDQSFVNQLATRVVELTTDGLKSFQGNYDDYLYFKAQETNQAEQKSQTGSGKGGNAHSEGSQDTNKELASRCKQLEHKIGQLEKKMEAVSIELGEHEYGTTEYEASEKQYDSLEKQLKDATKEWEQSLKRLGQTT